MRRTTIAAMLCASVLLAGCEARIGKDEDKGETTAESNGVAAEVAVEGKAEKGQFSINAPGFDLKFNIPKGLADRSRIDSDSELLYPGSNISGLHIEAGKAVSGEGDGAVELRFTSADAPDRIAAWYRDPARANDLEIASVSPEAGGFVVVGSQKRDGDPFKVRLGPGEGGGTDGRLILSDKR